MKSRYTTIPLLLLFAVTLSGQTSLGPGDIMFTLINTDNTDAFAFVLLKDVTAGTSFRVTKGEYKAGVLQTGDGTTEITFTSASSCGAEFLFTSQLNNGSSTGFYNPTSLNGGGTVTAALVDGTAMTLSSGGDGLIAFQGSTYLSILQKCGFGFGNADGQCSDLPPGLTVGINALAYTNGLTGSAGEPDNIKYSCSVTNGTPSQLSAALTTNSNWLEDNTTPISYGSGCGFVCAATCTDPTLTSISASNNSPCSGAPFSININGTLNNASQWRLHEGDCNGPIISTTSGGSFSNLTVTETMMFTVSALVCDINLAPVCESITITPLVPTANAGPDQLGSGTYPKTLAANNSGTGTGMWSVISGDGNGVVATPGSPTSSFSGTPGVGYTLRWTISGGGCPATSDEVSISSFVGSSTIGAGEIMFTMINTDDDGFAFVVLSDLIQAGSSFFVTDEEYRSGALTTDEGTLRITFTANATCGMEFLVISPESNGNFTGTEVSNESFITVSNEAGSMLLSSGGDGLISYQGNNNFISALQKCGFGFGNPDSQCSDLPPGLTEGLNALAYTNNLSGSAAEPDNIKYNCATNSGFPQDLRPALTNNSNWLEDDITAFVYGNGCDFDCQDCNDPVITNLSISPSPVCPGQETTLTITGDLMGANRWVVYAPGDCGGIELATSATNTITFTPNGTGTYQVAGVEGCVTTPNCSALPITQTGTPADITIQKPTTKLFGTSVALTAAPLGGGQTGTWSIVSGSDNNGVITDPSGPNATLTGPEGSGYQLQYSVTGNGCPETTDEVFVSFMVDIGMMFGDMVLTGYNSQSADNFSVVVLANLTPGTAFSVTDNGWLAAGGFRTGEQTANYFLCRPLKCGDNIRFEQDGNGYAPDGTVVAEIQNGSAFPQLSTSGDQLFLYGGFTPPSAGNEARFVSAIQMNCENGTCSEANWDGDATDNGSSARPSAFATGGSVFGGTAPANNARYDCTNGTSNSLDLFALISNDANWSFQNSAFTLDGCGFTCDPAPMAICQDITVQIDANGNPTTNGQPFMAADLDGGSTDNGSIDPNGFSVNITPGCANVTNPVSATTITLTVTDDLGQTATCTSQVTVEDNVAPVITCQDISVDLDANGNFSIINANFLLNNVLTSFTDNCAASPFPQVNGTKFNFNCADGASATGTYFFFDGSPNSGGNQASCLITITINDPTFACDDDPVAMCQATAIVQIDANGNADASSLDNGSTDDNTAAGDLLFSIAGDVLGCDDVDMPAQVVTLVVTDNVGQTATCTSEVTVEDNIAPVITCQNVAVDLLADGTFNSNSASNFFLDNVLTSFSDNCAPNANSLIGAFQIAFGCADIGINNETYFFRDRALGPTSQEDNCNVLIQINDPLGVCGSAPVVNCQDFAVGPDPDGSYTLDANSLDNGSTDDRSVYTLVFGTEQTTIGQQSDDSGNFNNTGHGQSFTAPQTGNIQKIKVRFFAAKSNATLYLYNSGTGSGTAGSIGTPAYTQTGIELFAGPTGGLTEILLNTPFPVVSGQQYSFAFEGNTHPYYSSSDVYSGGDFIFGYDLSSGCCTFGDLVFEIDFIGPTTQEFTGDGDYPVTVYAVDDQGNISGACNATFTLDQLLPVEWLYFGANAGAKTVDLQWETSTEPDNAGFHVERSATGNDWNAIGEVPARTGSDQRYDFVDDAPLEGTSYYRLRQTDYDGATTHSPVATVEFYGDEHIVVFPNPATGEVSVRLPDGAELIGLLDVTGRAAKVRFEGQNGQRRTDVSSLPAGIYFLRARLADGKMSARRLMVR